MADGKMTTAVLLAIHDLDLIFKFSNTRLTYIFTTMMARRRGRYWILIWCTGTVALCKVIIDIYRRLDKRYFSIETLGQNVVYCLSNA